MEDKKTDLLREQLQQLAREELKPIFIVDSFSEEADFFGMSNGNYSVGMWIFLEDKKFRRREIIQAYHERLFKEKIEESSIDRIVLSKDWHDPGHTVIGFRYNPKNLIYCEFGLLRGGIELNETNLYRSDRWAENYAIPLLKEIFDPRFCNDPILKERLKNVRINGNLRYRGKR